MKEMYDPGMFVSQKAIEKMAVDDRVLCEKIARLERELGLYEDQGMDQAAENARKEIASEKDRILKIQSREINGSFEIKSALFQDIISNGRQYLWGEGETSDVTGPTRVCDLIDDWGMDGGTWVIFYLEDCAFPPLYAIRGRTWEDAYEAFIDWHAENQHGLKIEESEMTDYDPDSFNYTSNGIPVDTESVRGFEVKLISVTMA